MAELVLGEVLSIGRQMSKILYFKREISLLQSTLKPLEEKRFNYGRLAVQIKKNGDIISSQYLLWVQRVNNILQEGEIIIREARSNNFCDLKLHLKLVKEIEKVMEKIDNLPDFILKFPDTSGTVYSFWKRLIKVLMNEEDNSIVGLHGVVGNCERVALEVCERAKEKNLFDEVVIVNIVSKFPNVYMIQCDLIRKLGLEIEEGKNMKEKSQIIDQIFVGRKVLVILCNVREKFELSDIGILDEYQKSLGSQVIVISPGDEILCSDVRISRLLQVPSLNGNDWNYFNHNVQLRNVKAGRECIANECVNRYCGGMSYAENVNLKKLAGTMNTWIKRIEESNGIKAIADHDIKVTAYATADEKKTADEKELHKTRMELFTPSDKRFLQGLF